MKKFIFLIIFIISCFGSFYVGVDVGADKMGMHRVAFDAYIAADDLAEEDGAVDRVITVSQRNEAKIFESLGSYGQYLDSWASKIPLLGLDSTTNSFMEKTLGFYLKKEPNFMENLRQANVDLIEDLKSKGDYSEIIADEIRGRERRYELVFKTIYKTDGR